MTSSIASTENQWEAAPPYSYPPVGNYNSANIHHHPGYGSPYHHQPWAGQHPSAEINQIPFGPFGFGVPFAPFPFFGPPFFSHFGPPLFFRRPFFW